MSSIIERTNVYAFEQDMQEKVRSENTNTNGREDAEDLLSDTLKMLLKWQFPRNPLTRNIVLLTFMVQLFLVASIICDSTYIGIAFAAPLAPVWFYVFNKIPDFGKGVIINTIGIDRKLYYIILKKVVIMFVIIYLIMILLMVATSAVAKNLKLTTFGVYTDVMLYILPACMIPVAYIMTQVVFNFSILIYTVSIWNKKIKSYMEKIREELLEFDLENRNKTTCLNEIYKEQEIAEGWAVKVNNKFMMLSGSSILLCIMTAVSVIIIISIMQTVNPSPTNAWKIGIMAFFSLFFTILSLVLLYYLARPNQMWLKHSNGILNDARIVIRKEELFGLQFDNWLSQQELNALRIFNVKLTMKLLGRITAG